MPDAAKSVLASDMAAARKGPRRSAERATGVVTPSDLPRQSLEEALNVPRVLREAFGGAGATWPEIAAVLKIDTPEEKRDILRSAQAYNLLDRDDDHFAVSEIARRILEPQNADDARDAMIQAVLTPVFFSRFFTDYAGSLFPSDDLLGPVLQRRYGLSDERIAEAKRLLHENGAIARILEENVDGLLRVRLPEVTPAPSELLSTGSQVEVTPAQDFEHMCFVITPIGDDDSRERKHANTILKGIIEPVVTELGLFARRADQIDRSGIITQQVFECLARARVAVADLSFGNPNAFYELGIRHVFKLPTVQLIRKGDKIPFDVSQGRTIRVDISDVYTFLDAIESAKRELRQYLKHALSSAYKGEDNPLTTYLPGAQVRLFN